VGILALFGDARGYGHADTVSECHPTVKDGRSAVIVYPTSLRAKRPVTFP
jgi:hypothetical protein